MSRASSGAVQIRRKTRPQPVAISYSLVGMNHATAAVTNRTVRQIQITRTKSDRNRERQRKTERYGGTNERKEGERESRRTAVEDETQDAVDKQQQEVRDAVEDSGADKVPLQPAAVGIVCLVLYSAQNIVRL